MLNGKIDSNVEVLNTLNEKYKWIPSGNNIRPLPDVKNKKIEDIFKYEQNVTEYCAKQGYAGAITGHIHTPEIKKVNGIVYMNCGDWVENTTALVEHHDGRFEIVEWKIK